MQIYKYKLTGLLVQVRLKNHSDSGQPSIIIIISVPIYQEICWHYLYSILPYNDLIKFSSSADCPYEAPVCSEHGYCQCASYQVWVALVWLVDHSHLFDLISVAILVWSPQLSQKGASLKIIITKPDTLFSMIRLEALLVDLAWEANSIRQGHCLRYHCWIANQIEDWAILWTPCLEDHC